MATVLTVCASCGKSIQPARTGSGQLICPACRVPLASAADAPKRPSLPTPQPAARQSAAPSTVSRRGALPGSHRPATPGEALSGVSSGSWLPAPDPGPSPDAVNARTAPNRMHSIARGAGGAAGQGSPWLRPPGIYYLGAGGAVIVGILLLVIVVATQKSSPNKPPPVREAATGGDVAIVTARPAPATPTIVSAAPTIVSAAPAVVPPTPSATIKVAVAKSVPTGPRVVDLMPLIDPDRDGGTGRWKMEADGLTCTVAMRGKLGIPYQLPEEYDFRIEYTRQSVEELVGQIFTLNKHRGMWAMNGWKGTISGFQFIDDKQANANYTLKRNLPFHVGDRHVSLVKVRKGSVEALVDGKVVCSMKTDGSDLSLDAGWDLPDYPLGLACYAGVTVFHKIELIESPVD